MLLITAYRDERHAQNCKDSWATPAQRRRGAPQDSYPASTSSTSPVSKPTAEPLIAIVCISDTHNYQPDLPPGDILIHAGDLTENGSFDELHAQFTWLNSQPHPHKLVIAGNHDFLLDEAFLARHPERRCGSSKKAADLDFGTLHYLNDSSISIEVSLLERRHPHAFRIWLAVHALQHPSAFQYPAAAADRWRTLIPPGTDIVVTHGPPRLHLDEAGARHVGCAFLAEALACWCARGFGGVGHIHAGRGREDAVLHRVRQVHDDVANHWRGWGTAGEMALLVAWAGLQCVFGKRRWGSVTTFVNAAVVGGRKNKIKYEARVVEI